MGVCYLVENRSFFCSKYICVALSMITKALLIKTESSGACHRVPSLIKFVLGNVMVRLTLHI